MHSCRANWRTIHEIAKDFRKRKQGLRGGFALFALLLKAWKKGLNREDATSAAVATLRYTAFLGVFSGAYVLVDESLAQKYGPQRSKHWRAAVAGLLAGPSLMLTGQPHTSLAIYIHFRSLVLLARVGLKKEHPLLKVLLTPLRFEHGDVALMCAAAAQIL
ncbi:hypothetical protein CYMTET_45355 [Cymbomonas tetramitiformis]|uniref:Uncharacterized protein n=1 Tax=Cymbomonas tetramitiformis TaxID=36881 RepID=A0AAE0BZH4_9CHLO|nr:hypothetical protein CYMTET_45355 [Cymbomonas tetramitiformis]